MYICIYVCILIYMHFVFKCAHANRVRLASLIIDGYFLDILKEASSTVAEIEFMSDGSWVSFGEDAEKRKYPDGSLVTTT